MATKIRAIRIDEKTWAKLIKVAKPEGVSALIRRLIKEFLDQR